MPARAVDEQRDGRVAARRAYRARARSRAASRRPAERACRRARAGRARSSSRRARRRSPSVPCAVTVPPAMPICSARTSSASAAAASRSRRASAAERRAMLASSKRMPGSLRGRRRAVGEREQRAVDRARARRGCPSPAAAARTTTSAGRRSRRVRRHTPRCRRALPSDDVTSTAPVCEPSARRAEIGGGVRRKRAVAQAREANVSAQLIEPARVDGADDLRVERSGDGRKLRQPEARASAGIAPGRSESRCASTTPSTLDFVRSIATRA